MLFRLVNFYAFCFAVVAATDREQKRRKKKNERLHLNARDPLESAQLLKLQLRLHEVDHTFVQCDPGRENDEYLVFFFHIGCLHVVLLDLVQLARTPDFLLEQLLHPLVKHGLQVDHDDDHDFDFEVDA